MLEHLNGQNGYNANVHSAIEFKKKKHFESPPTPPSQKLSRFNFQVTSQESKTPEKEELPFYKSKSVKQRRDFSIDDF